MDFALIETLRWEPETGFVRLNLHLKRLQDSARVLGLSGSEKAEQALSAAVSGKAALRVRLELFPDGGIEVTTAPFVPQPEETIWKLKIAETHLRSDDPLLRHKTSKRDAYMAARAEFSANEADEVVLTNEKGEICEGTITSLFVDDGAGQLLTPPLSSGLLEGVLRTELLRSGKAREQALTPNDLAGRQLYVGNSLRGLICAKF